MARNFRGLLDGGSGAGGGLLSQALAMAQPAAQPAAQQPMLQPSSMTYQVDPMSSGYFDTAASGDAMSNMSGYRDSALMQTLSQLPGSEAFYRQSPGGDDTSAAGIDPQALQAYLQQQGYSIYDDPTGAGGTLRVMNGDQMLGSESYSNEDQNFGIASSLVGAAGGSFMGAANGLGSMASGALSGGMAAGAQEPTLQSIGQGALIGGAIGGVTDYMGGADAAPSLEAGGQSPAPWANQGSAPSWYQEMTQQSVAPWASSSPSLMGGIGAAALTPMEVPSEEWQSVPTPTPATPEALSSNAIKTLPSSVGAAAGGGLLESLTSNPRLAAAVAGGLLGGSGGAGGSGGGSYNGPMPTITRGGWSPTATPTYTQPAPGGPRLNTQPGQANSGLWRFMGGGQ